MESSNDDGQEPEQRLQNSSAKQEYSIGASNMFSKSKTSAQGKLTMRYSLHYANSRASQTSNNKQFFGVLDTDNLSSQEEDDSDYNNFLNNQRGRRLNWKWI